MRTLVHISDLHFGRTEQQVVENLTAFVRECKPNLTVISGDLTQRAKISEFEQARDFIRGLETPHIVIPGNHDVPLWNIFLRFWKPYARYQKFINEQLSPVFEDSEISVIGLNTAHGKTIAGGRFKSSKLQKMAEHWKTIPQKTKIIVSHHPFELFFTESPVKRLGYKNRLPSETILQIETDLLLSGHFHQGESIASAKVLKTKHVSVLSIQAGTATSTRTRSETNSFNKILIDGNETKVEKWEWLTEQKKFGLKKVRTFSQTEEGWIQTEETII